MKCPACGDAQMHEHIRVKMTVKEWLDAGGEATRIWVRCRECGHLSVNPLPEQALLYAATDEWELGQTPPEASFTASISTPLDGIVTGHALERCEDVFNLRARRWPYSLLDVGAGIGAGAIYAAMLGWSVTAIERREAVKPIYDSMGVHLIIEDALEADPVTPPDYDVVWCEETIEHICDIELFLSHLHSWASRSGGVYLTTPNGAWRSTWPPETWACFGHVHAFTPDSIRLLAKRVGLDVVSFGYAWRADRTLAAYLRRGRMPL